MKEKYKQKVITFFLRSSNKAWKFVYNLLESYLGTYDEVSRNFVTDVGDGHQETQKDLVASVRHEMVRERRCH